MDHQILLFATGDCPHCRAAREALQAWGGPFEERDPLSNRVALKELMMVSAVAVVPTIVVSGQVLVGFDAVRLEEMLQAPVPEPEPPDDFVVVDAVDDES